jgi:hypothetical protein
MHHRRLGLSLGLSIVAVACTGSIAEQNHPCPCGDQWTCCAGANLCVPAGSTCPAIDAGSSPSPSDGAAIVEEASILDAGQTQLMDAVLSIPLVITFDGGVGGLCVVADAAPAAVSDAGSPDMDATPATDAQPGASCMCTRRPGAGSNAHECPAGIGEFGESTIGPAGGTVNVQGRQFVASGVAAELDFPPTAIATPTDIKLIETNIPPPRDLIDWSPVYLVEPAGLDLSVSTLIQFPWSSGPISSSSGPTEVTAAGLSIWFSPDGRCFTRVSDSYTNAGFEQGSTTQLGYFIVGTPRTEATASCP